jgi:hypothetical protein
MKILIKPSQIVELCLWNKYEYYVLPKDVDKKKFLNDDLEFEIDEKDAYVIGLLNCVETDNLVHKFNEYIESYMSNRSSRIEDTFKVKKKFLIQTTSDFKSKFPEFWSPRKPYDKALVEVNLYIDDLLTKFESLPTEEIKEKTGTFEYVNCNAIKKILKYHN